MSGGHTLVLFVIGVDLYVFKKVVTPLLLQAGSVSACESFQPLCLCIRTIVIVTRAFASQASREDTVRFSRTGVPAPRVKMADGVVLSPLVMNVTVYTDTQEPTVRSVHACTHTTHTHFSFSLIFS